MSETIIAELSRTFTPRDEYKHIALPFTVEGGYRCLKIHYSYFPKDYEDEVRSVELVRGCAERSGTDLDAVYFKNAIPIKNLLTLSIDSPNGAVGCAHRHGNDLEIVIGAEPSYGFLPTEITAGEWRAVVSTHCALSENIDLKITVRGGI
ncbi:MAG: hypothetical protein LBT20_00530 [Clostridiales bacterium]|jgi:hypothetical protein|nr:hypothetical protein [Clostridiales bacterium]